MTDRLLMARFVQVGFFVTGVALLLAIYIGLGGLAGALIAVAVTMPFSFLIVFGLRCRNCGVSYYFDPSASDWNVTGVNVFKPVQPRCPKCSAPR